MSKKKEKRKDGANLMKPGIIPGCPGPCCMSLAALTKTDIPDEKDKLMSMPGGGCWKLTHACMCTSGISHATGKNSG